MPILTPSQSQQIAEITQWLNTQADGEIDIVTQLQQARDYRDTLLGEMRFLIQVANDPNVTQERIATSLFYLKERQAKIIKINALLQLEATE